MRRLFYSLMYLLGRARWDTNVTPPEVVEVIEAEGLPAGRALDLGCGTGTNSVYMARHGWQVIGIDFVPRAIRQARRKARRAGVGERVRFLVASVARLCELNLPTFDLVVDIGCLHSLAPEQQADYADGLRAVTRPGAIFMLYAMKPREGRMGPMGLSPDDVRQLFEPHFRVVHVEHGEDMAAGGGSAWYRLERLA